LPVKEIKLKPKPSYPFPDNATLVRGIVVDPNPVSWARVKAVGKPFETLTNEKGEFVLFVKNIVMEDVTVKIEKDAISKLVSATVNEGKTTNLGLISFPI
jgi:hypothetical protein